MLDVLVSDWDLEEDRDFFSRMRILAGGHILEDIEMNNRVHDMFGIRSATYSRENDFGDGFSTFLGDTIGRFRYAKQQSFKT